MKLSENEIDLSQEEQAHLNKADDIRKGIKISDAKLSMDLPIVVKYDYVDTGKTQYSFSQKFCLCDTQKYFEKMKEITHSTINELEEKSSKDKNIHFYRSQLKGKIREVVKQIFSTFDDSLIIYHFDLYTSREEANRQNGTRSPRIYFALGTNGFIYPLFFDPYHELNP